MYKYTQFAFCHFGTTKLCLKGYEHSFESCSHTHEKEGESHSMRLYTLYINALKKNRGSQIFKNEDLYK